MKRSFLVLFVTFVSLLLASGCVFAHTGTTGHFLNRNFYVNGTQYQNEFLNNQIILYDDVTYIPLNAQMEAILGFHYKMDRDDQLLKIKKTAVRQPNPLPSLLIHNLENITVSPVRNVTAKVWSDTGSDTVLFSQFPLLQAANGVLYLPLRALTGSPCFGWSACYNDNTGVFISTDPAAPATSLTDASESAQNAALVQYICKKNPSVSQGFARELVFLFRHESRITGQSIALLVAMAEKESTFRPDAVGSGGSIGLMQIKASTAKGYGYSAADLHNPHKNIELGAHILKQNRASFGTVEKALAAYNQGAGAVSRGQIRSGYYTRVLRTQSAIQKALTNAR